MKKIIIILALIPVLAKAQIGVYKTLRTKGDSVVVDSLLRAGRLLLPVNKSYSSIVVDRAGWINYNTVDKAIKVRGISENISFKDSAYNAGIITGLSSIYVPLSGNVTISGIKTINNSSSTIPIRLNNSAASTISLAYYNANVLKYNLVMNSNATPGFEFKVYNSSGTFVGNAYTIDGTTALMTIPSPAFTGTPTAPTAAASTNTTQIATTAFVKTVLPIPGSFSGTGTATTAFTVTIGSTMANNTYKVNATPTSALAAAPFYVTNKTTTTFQVVYLTGLTGTVTFDWSVFP